MKLAIAILLLCTALAFGQAPSTNVPSGQLSFTAINGPFGSAGVDIFGTYGVTENGELREDNFIFPSANGSAYIGSYQYRLDRFVCPLVINTNLNCNKFSTYLNAGAGVGRTTIGDNAVNHVGGCVGAGVNWDPSSKGQFTVNLVDFHECRYNFETVRGWTTTAAVGVTFGFGTNAPATQAKLERFRRQQAKRLKRMQERAKRIDEAGRG